MEPMMKLLVEPRQSRTPTWTRSWAMADETDATSAAANATVDRRFMLYPS
jgi:hypothetical protein